MSYMLLFLVIIFLFKGKNNDFFNLLSNLDLSNVLPLLEMLGVDKDVLNTISSTNLKGLFENGFDIKNILPVITPLLKTFMAKQNFTSQANQEVNFTMQESLNVSPIKDFASEEINQAFSSYFSS